MYEHRLPPVLCPAYCGQDGETMNVPQENNCVYLLNEMFDKDDNKDNDYKILNLGMSGHFFEVTASNYEYIAEKYKDAKYIVIEMFDAKYSPEVLDDIIQNKFHEPMQKKGFVYETLQKVSFFRLMYKKLNETRTDKNTSAEVVNIQNTDVDNEALMDSYIEKMSVILTEIAEISAQNDIVPIILMHERFWEDKDRNIVMETDEVYKKAFVECCKERAIDVVDASVCMVEEYNNTSKLSYGFSNTVPGEGHLNKTGHRIVAECVYKYINEREAQR